MRRKTRRLSTSFQVESLETRSLMSVAADGGGLGSVIAPWNGDQSQSVLVGFKSGLNGATIASELAGVGGRLVTYRDNGPSLVELAPWENLTVATQQLSASPTVRYVSPNATIHATGAVTPNDPKYPAQWALPFIDAPDAWGVTTGSASTIIAVLDSGIDLRNADFSSKLWTNPDPSGADGYPRDFHGWNFVTNTNNIQDNDGHGSHVSGIIAAASNNAFGVTGLNWNARLMPLKVLDSQGNGTVNNAVSGIYYAVNHGAKVINASWGGIENSQALVDALNFANSRNVVFVTAAGNESANNDVTPSYPGSYRTPNELVVAAVDQSGNLADFSNYGPHTVDIAAPGVNILSSVISGYAYYSGTSMATAFVSATAALIAGQNPNMSATDIVARVRATAKPLAQLSGKVISGGIVDAYFAVKNQVGGGGSGAISNSGGPSLSPSNSSRNAIESAILGGDEVYQSYGRNPNTFVIATYNALYGRAPTTAELSQQVRALTIGTQSRYDMINAMQGSTEGLRTKVARWYSQELGRPGSLGDLKNESSVIGWANMLASGTSENTVRLAILSADSFYRTVGGRPRFYVQSLYRAIYGREATRSEIVRNAARARFGPYRAALVNRMLNSPEARLATIARLFSSELGRPGTIANLKYDGGVGNWAYYLGNS